MFVDNVLAPKAAGTRWCLISEGYRFRFFSSTTMRNPRDVGGEVVEQMCIVGCRLVHIVYSLVWHTRGAIHSPIASGGGILLSGCRRVVGSLSFTDFTVISLEYCRWLWRGAVVGADLRKGEFFKRNFGKNLQISTKFIEEHRQ